MPAVEGLTQAEAARRLREEGPNELPQARPLPLWRMAAEVMREPMFLLLVACAAVYLMLGDLREALGLLVAVVAVISLTLYQRYRTERALEALRDLSSPRALVIRDGVRQRIAGRDVARGDWVVLGEGDRVPADGVLVDANHFSADESLLSGESVPVRKRADAAVAAMQPPGGEGGPFVYAGTLVTSGRGVARMEATGARTELGRIGAMLQSVGGGESGLQRETGLLVRRVAIGAVFISLTVAAAVGLPTGRWLDGVLAGIAAAMALLPEEFPVVLAVFLAMGAWRMSRRQVLARSAAAVEALGAVTVLCVDKTGTLTENRMTVRALVPADGARVAVGAAPLPERAHRLVEFAILGTPTDPFDPMERAIRALGLGDLVDAEHLHRDWRMVREYPLGADLLAMSEVWEPAGGGPAVIAAKGAPEAIVELCHLAPEAHARVLEQVRALSDDGLRVLAVAEAGATHAGASVSAGRLPATQHDFEFRFLGLLGLADPVRREVPAAVAACASAGIRVLMITGDHPGTARNIAREAGIPGADAVVTGDELERWPPETLAARLRDVAVVARARPAHKLRIVEALQARGESVGMTGDGVNDAPALRAADVGIAMGQRGTDVAREAADLVVSDDNFSSIVEATRLGRRIFANLQHAMGYIVAVHVPIAGMALLPPLLGWPLMLLPMQVVFLELVIDPACTFVFEAEEGHPDTMRRPPRPRAEPLLGRRALAIAALQGLLVLAFSFAAYLGARASGLGEEAGRGLVFGMLVVGNLALLYAKRSRSRGAWDMFGQANRPLWMLTAGALACLVLVYGLPILRTVFHVAAPPAAALALTVAVGAALIAPLSLLNRLVRPPAPPAAGAR